ncbi:MaoC family dehydratase [Fulvimarina sp. MAC8]|uniref:MaoC family dehydratase n=1 Tax=Fulvimarina sp. MAC8 TaxID=3162874 RepID=UPI0032EC3D90
MAESKNDGWAGTINGRPETGQSAERSRTTSMADIEAFTAISGDRNPLHYDEELAKASPFGRLVVQGGIISGILNAVVAEDLPGPGTVFMETHHKFLKPIGVGETMTGRVEITDVRADKPICKMEVSVVNGDGETCLSGTATTYTMPLTP